MRFCVLTAVLLVATVACMGEESNLVRSKGVSIHMLPRRVAELGGTEPPLLKWGLGVSAVAEKYYTPQSRLVFQDAVKLLEFVRGLPKTVQENGIWIVVTHPSAYSEEEHKLLEATKGVCLKEGVPLFVCRGMDLPNGWKRIVAEKQDP